MAAADLVCLELVQTDIVNLRKECTALAATDSHQ